MFSSGKSLASFPIKILYEIADDVAETLQGGVAVSSRNFKKAVHRNRVKRVIREAYRMQKHLLQAQLEQSQKKMILFIIYTGKEMPVYDELNRKMQDILQRLTALVATGTTS